ncbi:hypothetical protein BW686_11050 [Pseudomonas syringae]|uniref:Uncharacterized protein n=1 Tax=Pseudomonas syringae TaxID=317 RepID=A0A244ESF8_PSESX|nr:hypothetical protein [Pseudomonas syringae]OUM07445.1 hypothetical protein BW686_11050 [Pseudomonas syringae]
MAYGSITDFMHDVGDGVGEFLRDEEKQDFTPLRLDEIVKNYIDERGFLSIFILSRQVNAYIKKNVTAQGLAYVDPPFGQETSFPEDYFEGDLYVFLTNVLTLLDLETKRRVREFFRLNRTV